MKKPIIAAVAVVLVAAVSAGIIYTVSSSHRTSASAAPRTAFDKQIAFHEERLRENPDDAESYRRLAAALNLRAESTGDGRDYDRALAELAKAEKFEPGSLELLLARAATLLSRHNFADARAAAEEGLKRAPNVPDFIGLAGDAALQTGDLDAAERHYRRLAELEPKKASSWTRVAYLAEMRGELDRAAELMEKAINVSYPKPLSPSNFAWARAVLGEIELKRGNNAEARRQYMWGLAKSPDHPLALEHLAELDETEGDYAAAEAGFRKIVGMRPDDAENKLRLAKLLERRGEREESTRLRGEAHDFCQRAVASGNDGYLRPLATLELEAGNYARAAELAARDLSLRPSGETRAFAQKVSAAAAAAGRPVKIP